MEHDEARQRVLSVLARGAIGLDEFESKSRKTLDDLCKELVQGAATFDFNPVTGRMERVSQSLKIAIEACGFELREIKRVYIGKEDDPVIHPEPKDGASETPLPGETPFETARRCLREEWGLTDDEYICRQQLIGAPEELEKYGARVKGVLAPDWLSEHPFAAKRDVHESKAWYRVQSVVETRRMRLVMPQMRWPNGRRLKDENVRLFLEWQPLFDIPELKAAGVG